MGQLVDWTLKKIDGIPPIPFPFLLALTLLFVLLFPTIRRAWRAQGHKPQRDEEPVPIVQLNAGGVYTILVNLEIQVANLHRDVSVLTENVRSVERLLSKRKRSRSNGAT